MDIASIATNMSAMDTSVKVATAVLKKTMDSSEDIAMQLVSQIADLDVGVSNYGLDIEI